VRCGRRAKVGYARASKDLVPSRSAPRLLALALLVGPACAPAPAPRVETPIAPSAPTPPSEPADGAIGSAAEPSVPELSGVAEPMTTSTAPSSPAAALPPMTALDPAEVDLAAQLARADARFADVEAHVRAKRWPRARAALSSLLSSGVAQGRLDLELGARALSALVAALAGDAKAAEASDAAVLGAWKDPDASAKQLAAEAGGNESELQRRLGLALSAVGQATFARAEIARATAAAMALPVLHGAATQAAVNELIRREVAPWMQRKRQALEDAEQAYKKVLDLRPLPPPRWVIAASERVGTMWSDFAQDFAKVPTPKEWAKQPEIVEAYRSALAGAAEPIAQRAQAAYRACVATSDKFRIEDEHSRTCRARVVPAP
jgi:hypothetical protein